MVYFNQTAAYVIDRVLGQRGRIEAFFMKKLYVGNLPWSVDDGELEALFSAMGTVHSARVITDRDTGRSRGFGFVELDDDAATRAIEELNGNDFGGRQLRVNEAVDRRR